MQLKLFAKPEPTCAADISDCVEKLTDKQKQQILFRRRQHLPSTQIAKVIGLTTNTVNKFLKSYFKHGRDPLQIHVAKSMQLGESIAEISRRLNCHKTEIDKLMVGVEVSGMDSITRRVIELREKLWPVTRIIREVSTTQSRATWIIKKHFGDKDPFVVHVIESLNAGESGKSVCRRMGIYESSLRRILEKTDIDLWHNYLQRKSEHYQKNGISKLQYQQKLDANKSRHESIAEDLFCVWQALESVKKVSEETGFAPTTANHYLLSLEQYKKLSEQRKAESRYNRAAKVGRQLSSQFKTEKEFNEHCAHLLAEHYYVESNVSDKSHMEIDLLVHSDGGVEIIIELKIVSRKVIAAQALGQVMLNRCSFDTNTQAPAAVICFPDDVDLAPGFDSLAKEQGVYVVKVSGLVSCINGLCSDNKHLGSFGDIASNGHAKRDIP